MGCWNSRKKSNDNYNSSIWTHCVAPISQKQVLCDMEYGKEFILCEYNRDADSYR